MNRICRFESIQLFRINFLAQISSDLKDIIIDASSSVGRSVILNSMTIFSKFIQKLFLGENIHVWNTCNLFLDMCEPKLKTLKQKFD